MNSVFNRFGEEYFFSTPPESNAIYLFLFFYLAVAITAVLIFLYTRRKGEKNSPLRSFGKKILWLQLPIALVGLFFVFCRYEFLRAFSWRFWQYLVLIVFVAASVWIYLQWKKLKADLIKYKNQTRKEKWLKKVKKHNSKHKK